MPTIKVKCPQCRKDQVIKFGISPAGKQRYRCKNKDCSKNIFLLHYTNRGHLPEIKEKIVEMA